MATGLRFPEGPVAYPDGSVVLVEIERGTITRVWPRTARPRVVATPGGGPNGLAVGPDGALYCCNNGGFAWVEADGHLRPTGTPADYSGGRIERIDPATGDVHALYTAMRRPRPARPERHRVRRRRRVLLHRPRQAPAARP